MLNVPILIVLVRQDQSVSLPYGQQMHQFLTGTQFEIIDDAGHVTNFDDLEQFNQLAITLFNVATRHFFKGDFVLFSYQGPFVEIKVHQVFPQQI